MLPTKVDIGNDSRMIPDVGESEGSNHANSPVNRRMRWWEERGPLKSYAESVPYFTKWETRKASSVVVNELGRGPSCKLLALFRSALGKFNCVLWLFLFVTIRIRSKTRRWILGYVPRSYSWAYVWGIILTVNTRVASSTHPSAILLNSITFFVAQLKTRCQPN